MMNMINCGQGCVEDNHLSLTMHYARKTYKSNVKKCVIFLIPPPSPCKRFIYHS